MGRRQPPIHPSPTLVIRAGTVAVHQWYDLKASPFFYEAPRPSLQMASSEGLTQLTAASQCIDTSNACDLAASYRLRLRSARRIGAPMKPSSIPARLASSMHSSLVSYPTDPFVTPHHSLYKCIRSHIAHLYCPSMACDIAVPTVCLPAHTNCLRHHTPVQLTAPHASMVADSMSVCQSPSLPPVLP